MRADPSFKPCTNALGNNYTHSIASSLGPRPSRGEGKAWCTCTLISGHSRNSVLRTDNSVFIRHDRTLSRLLLGSLREREHSQYTSAEKRVQRLHYLSLELRQVNTIVSAQSQTRRNPTRSHGRILLDYTATEQEDCSVSSNA